MLFYLNIMVYVMNYTIYVYVYFALKPFYMFMSVFSVKFFVPLPRILLYWGCIGHLMLLLCRKGWLLEGYYQEREKLTAVRGTGCDSPLLSRSGWGCGYRLLFRGLLQHLKLWQPPIIQLKCVILDQHSMLLLLV